MHLSLSLSLSLSLISVAANSQTLASEADKGTSEKLQSTRSSEKAASQGNVSESKVAAEKQRATERKQALAEHLAEAADIPEVADSNIRFLVIDGLAVATTIDRLTGSMSIIVQNKVFHASHHGSGRYTLTEDRTMRDFLANLKIEGSPFNQTDKSKSIEDGEETLPPIEISGSNDADSGGGSYSGAPYYRDPTAGGGAKPPPNETPEQARLRGCKQSRDAGMTLCNRSKHPVIKVACVALVTVVYAMCTSSD